MKFVIKNMVCPRCITAVRKVFDELDLQVLSVELGNVTTSTAIGEQQKQLLRIELTKLGFELLDDKQTQLINQIKSIIISEVHHQQSSKPPFNLSLLLSQKLHYEYSYLSRLFSSVEGRTIEKFVMTQKIERVKELLTYQEWTLAQIADHMHYSSSAHLSAQFKKVTGMSPSTFKKIQKKDRRNIDDL